MSSKNNYSNLSKELLKKALRLDELGSQIFLLGQGISTFTKNEQIKLMSVVISFTGGVLLTVSTVFEFIQNYFSKNPIPKELNYNKLLGSIIGLISAIISTKTIFDIYDLHLPKEDVEDTSID
ncbi:hypothetical protein [Clostridium novyi]|uniref:Uncharacterized protein n=1 Tax=Clostridium novyi (strain NT) TaxID=386415 RepID=A0PZV0_CLONN|nr:hypothetical protein [Clostridium novyi]ABK61630.1 hypothetical protein NT01CX_1829 [Clostridium novyi NT]KEH88396.1 hypothetical protein Z966_03835 [Clostridium novyi A str. NCTC 538]